jgi:phosphate transport system permease protein
MTVDRFSRFVLSLIASSAVAFVILLFVFIAKESAGALGRGALSTFFGTRWSPLAGKFGLLPLLAGSLIVSCSAVAVAIPLGLGVTIVAHFSDIRMVRLALRRIIEVLAGLPSVVVGLWGLTALVPQVARLAPPGPSVLASALVLGWMAVPIFALSAITALESIPRKYAHNVAALGLSHSTLCYVLLRAAMPALVTGAIMTFGRVIGETMVVMMVAGNVPEFPGSPFAPVRTLTANIALEMGFATGHHMATLFAGGLALMLVAVMLAYAAQRVLRHAGDIS